MIDNTQIHLSSAYSCVTNKLNYYINKKDKINYDAILLYFRDESLKGIKEKVIANNKERIKFLSKKLVPITKMT